VWHDEAAGRALAPVQINCHGPSSWTEMKIFGIFMKMDNIKGVIL
jgi:hypothetical protein